MTDQRPPLEYWAENRKRRLGPFASHQEAAEAFRAAYPVKGYPTRRDEITTGYGAGAPYFDLRWHKPRLG